MARLGLVELEDAEFEAEGRTIKYRKVSLTLQGENLQESAVVPGVQGCADAQEAGQGGPLAQVRKVL